MTTKILALAFGIVVMLFTSLPSFSQDLTQPFRDLQNGGGESSLDKEYARLISQRGTGDNSIQLCQYQTNRGFTFEVNIKSNPCPNTVAINTKTMQIEIRNY
jgi:hypothetical protein